MATKGEIVQTIGEGLAGLGEHFAKIRNAQEITSAKVALSKGTDQIHIDSLKDPDIWGQTDKLEQKYSDSVQKASARIHDPETKEKFLNEAELIVSRKQTGLQTALFNKQSQLYKGTYQDRLSQLEKEYYTALPHDQGIIKQEMEREMKDAISVGGVNPEYAQHHLKTIQDNLGINLLKSDLGSVHDNPDAVRNVIDELNTGKQGTYKDVSPKQMKQAKDIADQELSHAERYVKENFRNQNHIYDKSATFEFSSGEMKQDRLNQIAGQGMSQERYDLLSKGLRLDIMPSTTGKETYAVGDLIDFGSDTDNHSERDTTNKILEDYNAKKISKKSASDLLQLFAVHPDNDPVIKLFKDNKKPSLENMVKAQDEKNEMSKEKRSRAGMASDKLNNHFGTSEEGKKASSEAMLKLAKNYSAEQKSEVRDTKAWHENQADSLISEATEKSLESAKIDTKNIPQEGKIVKAGAGWAKIYRDQMGKLKYHQISEDEANESPKGVNANTGA